MNGVSSRGTLAAARNARPGTGAGRTATRLRFRAFGLLSGAAMACLCLAATGAAAADGFYVGLGGGLVFPEDSDSIAQPTETYPTPFDGTSTYDRGATFSGAVGYRFADGLRVEAEISYRKHDFDEITVREPGSLAALSAWTFGTSPPPTRPSGVP